MRLWSFSLVFIALLGLLLILVGGDITIPIGIVLMGGAAVGAVSLGFYAVGRSEDRAREAEAAARGRSHPRPPAARGRAHHLEAPAAFARRLVANVRPRRTGTRHPSR